LFEQLVADLFQRTLEPCRKALADSGLKASEIDEVVLVGGSTRIPKVQEMVQEFFGREPHKGVNPDEVVAIGAAIQGGVLAGDVEDILLLDVTPLSLGIETQGGVFHKLIARNTTIPTDKSEIFSTAAESQTSVEVHVQQGEREMSRDNKTLGRFHLDGIPPAPRGIPQIEVSFTIDANGIVHVSAKDLGTGKEQKITITASSGLDEAEVARMVQEAEANAAEDKKNRESVETKNRADQLVYQMEKLLSENGDKLSEEDRKPVEEAIADLKGALEKEDAEAIKSGMERLEQASQKVATVLYQSTAAPGGESPGEAGPQASAASDEEDVIEAEVVDSGDGKSGS
jgi:molecular chaperone DnaK